MKTEEISINITKALHDIRIINEILPSPYFLPVKIIISEDEILKEKTIIFLYFNREYDEIIKDSDITIYQGKLSKKIQRIESSLEFKDIYERINSSNNQLKNIILYVFREYILNEK